MDTITGINAEIERVVKAMHEKSNELPTLRSDFQNAKATYENNFSRYLLETKAKNQTWTVQEVKSQATNLAYNDKLEAIKKESSYRKVVNELRALNTEFEGLREQAFNLRAELKRLPGQPS